MPKQAGSRGIGKKVASHDESPLADLGIERNLSHRCQTIAAVPKQRPGEYQRSHRESVAPSLPDLGINHSLSHRRQAIAEATFGQGFEGKSEINTSGVIS
jgi:hypothetical protein